MPVCEIGWSLVDLYFVFFFPQLLPSGDQDLFAEQSQIPFLVFYKGKISAER